ncbi:hypothetical protein NQ314_015013 [Rhamnusium bicolor]|uniref:DDE Tnp4 domain-containing protein n=1 Tax=Rhamnusium bicolor TaxID=1586634 RepID=A0AAV8WZ68_9CUCU|nr:hypothetical protein NQ314_015013 [Rhamnusium bicolor]
MPKLSRARIVVENVFGILSVVFRVLRKPMLLESEKTAKIVLACAFLHNFMRKSDSSERYNPSGTYDSAQFGEVIPGAWRVEGLPTGTFLRLKKVARKPSTLAKQYQNEFNSYFLSDIGKVPWQYKY